MESTQRLIVGSLIFLSSLLTACGGGDGISDDSSSRTPVTASGAITGFGSIYVNGVRYDTSSADLISSDDRRVLLSKPSNAELQAIVGLGQIVTVRGERLDDSNGVAHTISIDHELIGAVSSVSVGDASFVILGQTVSITPETIIDDSLIEALRGTEIPDDLRFSQLLPSDSLDQLLPVASVLAVSGFPSQNGFEATRIEDTSKQSGAGSSFEAEVKGMVTNLTPSQFNLNGLTVLYDSSVLDVEDFSTGSLSDGLFVEVRGSVDSSTQLTATHIEREDNLLDDDFNEGEVELEGIIQSIIADNIGPGGVVTINGVDIQVDDLSQFSAGLRIEIKAQLQADGSLIIQRIRDEQEDSIRLEDRVISQDGTALTTRLGLVIIPTERTRLENELVENDDNLSIADFLTSAVDESISARGFPLGSESVWTRIEIEQHQQAECRLRGPVDSASISGDANSFSFSIQGVSIQTASVSDNHFRDASDQPMGKAAFFNQLNGGDVIQVSSDSAGTGCQWMQLNAREIQFEPEDSVLLNTSGSSEQEGGMQNELVGAASNITANSFDLAGETILVTDDTIIDDSIIEAARTVEVSSEQRFGDLPETLAQLLSEGMGLSVRVSRSNGVVALSIEDL